MLVVLEGNPLEDIKSTSKANRMTKSGEFSDGETLPRQGFGQVLAPTGFPGKESRF